MVGALVAGLAYALIGTAGFCLAARRPRVGPVLATAFGLATLGIVGWAVFWAYLLSPLAGRLLGSAALLGAAVVVAISCRRSAETRRALVSVLPAVAMLLGISVVTVALIGLWDTVRDPFELARSRFSHPLPIDNEIPQLFADKLAAGEDPRTFLAGWQSSDRPPLQTGLMLLAHDITGRLGLTRSAAGFSAGVVAQFAWLPGIAILIRALGGRARGVLTGMLFAAMTGTVLVNTVFTWPKLISAAFVLAALAVLVEHSSTGSRLSWQRLGLAGVLVVLGLLSHGAALFAVPIVLVVLLWRRRALTLRAAGAAVAISGAAYLPWVLYQKFYDPPGTRLLFWHLANIGYPDPADGGVVDQVTAAYADAGWDTVLANKWANLTMPLSMGPWRGIGLHDLDLGSHRAAEFFTFSGAIGIGWLAVAAVIAAVVLGAVRGRPRDGFAARVVLLLGASVLSVLIWAMVMFGPSTTVVHHSTHVVILVALALPMAWLADRRPWAAALVTAAGVVHCLLTYVPFMSYDGSWVQVGTVTAVLGAEGPMSRRAIAVGLVGAALVALAYWLIARRRPDTVVGAPAPEDAVAPSTGAGESPEEDQPAETRQLSAAGAR